MPAPPASPLTRKHAAMLGLSALGGGLELYDFMVFVFFVPVISQVFFPPDTPRWLAELQTFTVFAVGFLARPLGGVLFGHFGDRIGRKRTFTFSVLLMAGATLAIALLPGYREIGIAAPVILAALRLVQGLAVGGEVAGGYVFASEHVPPNRRGLACGVLAAGATTGTLLGVSMATFMHMVASPQDILAFAWRIPFLVGSVLGLVTLILRRWLEETPVFQDLQRRRALAVQLPVKLVVREHSAALAVSALGMWVLVGHFAVLVLMGPTLLQTQYHFPAEQALGIGSAGTFCSFFACLVSGLMFDRLGPGRALLVASLLAGLASQFFLAVAVHHPGLLLPAYCAATFGTGLLTAVPLLAIRSFPPQVAFSGVSLAYNFGFGIMAGLTPIFIAAVIPVFPAIPMAYLLALEATGVALGFVLMRRPADAAPV
ncbi:MAG: MFS transporter [Pseudomonadota bacterium]